MKIKQSNYKILKFQKQSMTRKIKQINQNKIQHNNFNNNNKNKNKYNNNKNNFKSIQLKLYVVYPDLVKYQILVGVNQQVLVQAFLLEATKLY